jgi:glycerol uptake facilitator-like aquaporin
METYKYFMEFMGVLVLVYTLLLTDGNPVIMGLAYFGIYTLAKQTSGHFTPIGALAYYMAGRTNLKDLLMNISVQLFAFNCGVIFFRPLKALMQDFS